MKIYEIINEGPGGFHVPYELESEQGKHWDQLAPAQRAQWTQRQQQLRTRAQSILNKLIASMPPEEQAMIKGYKLDIPIRISLAEIAYNDDKNIAMDLGTFWDMSDSSLAYVLGHELGHIVWYGRKKYNRGANWDNPKKKLRKVQEELDCDTYGATIAYKLGYDARDALKHFDYEARSWRYDVNKPGYNYYPDFTMRQANMKKAIAQAQAEQNTARAAELQKQLDADSAKQQAAKVTDTEPATAPNDGNDPAKQPAQPAQPAGEPTAPNDGTDPALNNATQTMFNHISQGIMNIDTDQA